MIAVTGFDDREMINRALMYRYILSYEPFNFKGNIRDVPDTVDYGKKMDDLRRRYKDYLWDAEFRDTLTAKVFVNAKQYPDYTVFLKKNGLRAVVIANDRAQNIEATLELDKPTGSQLLCASPEQPVAAPCNNIVAIQPRSVIAVMESNASGAESSRPQSSK